MQVDFRSTFGLLVLSIALSGCELVNPEHLTQQPDATICGHFLEVTPSQEDPLSFEVRIRIAIPRAIAAAKQSTGLPSPKEEEETLAEVTVTSDTVVLAMGREAWVEDFAPGTEVAVIPAAGTTFRIEASRIRMEAEYLVDFSTFRGWKLPDLEGVEGHPTQALLDDPALINTSGMERTPVPIAGGRVLYFSARLRVPAEPDEAWLGARRQGLEEPGKSLAPSERTYRTQLSDTGWSEPKLVLLPGTEEATVARITWINEEETLVLVTLQFVGELSSVGKVVRSNAGSPWGSVERIKALGPIYTSDATYLAGSDSKIVFVSSGNGLDRADLFLYDPAANRIPFLLDSTVNTPGREWAPRVGPANRLIFGRDDHQLYYAQGKVQPLRLPGSHRALISQANPTRDGKWMFFCLPKLTPVELDQDIWVARLNENFSLSEAVPIDSWRAEH